MHIPASQLIFHSYNSKYIVNLQLKYITKTTIAVVFSKNVSRKLSFKFTKTIKLLIDYCLIKLYLISL